MAGSLKKVGIGADDCTFEGDESYPLSTWSRQGSLGTITGLTKMPNLLMTHQDKINARYYNSGALTDVTIQAAITAIGSSDDRVVYLEAGTWVISTAITATSNIYFEFSPGAVLQPAAGITFTIYSPENIIASPRQQIFDITNNSTDPAAFTKKGVVRPDWFVNNATPGTTDMQAAINLANDCSASDSKIKLSGDDYAVGTRIDLEDRILDGNGSTIIALSASMTVIRTIKRGWGIHNLTIDVNPLTFTGVALHIGAGKEDNLSNVHLTDSGYNSSGNVVDGTGTGLLLDAFTVVYDGKSVSFCNFDNLTITGFYYAVRSETTAANYAFYQGNNFNNVIIYGFVEAFKWYKMGNNWQNVVIQSSTNSKKVFDLYWSASNNFVGQVWDWYTPYVTAWDYFGNLDDTSNENYIEINSDLEKYPITDEGTGNLIVQANTAQENTWEITVGSGEEFETLSAALEHLVMRQAHWRMIGRNATITLASGYELAEEIEYTGVNMGWITITGTDASHNIDQSSLTQAAFLFQDSVAPRFQDCQFDMDTSGEVLDETDFATHENWDVTGEVDDSGGNAAFTFDGGSGSLNGTLKQVNADQSGTVADSTSYQFSYTVAVTTAPDGDFALVITGGAGEVANSDTTLPFTAGKHVVTFTSHASASSGDFTITASETTSTQGEFTIDDVSLVRDGLHGIHLVNSSMHLLGDSGITNAGDIGLFADRASTVQAEGPGSADVKDFSGAGTTGVYMDGASRANFDNLDASDANEYGIYAFGGSYVNAPDTTATDCGLGGVRIAYASIANIPDSDVSNAGSWGIRAGYGSIMNARAITATGAGINGALAEAGSTICAKSGNTRIGVGDDVADTKVDDGAFIEFHASTGGVSQAANTLTEEGAIFE